jgi:hypothetical protein
MAGDWSTFEAQHEATRHVLSAPESRFSMPRIVDNLDEAFWILCDDLPYVLAPAELCLSISIKTGEFPDN